MKTTKMCENERTKEIKLKMVKGVGNRGPSFLLFLPNETPEEENEGETE